jgi:hypothetical protein
LQPLSVSLSQTRVVGVQTLSVHEPAVSLQSAAESQVVLTSQRSPSSEQRFSVAPSQRNVPGLHTAQARAWMPRSQSCAVSQVCVLAVTP